MKSLPGRRAAGTAILALAAAAMAATWGGMAAAQEAGPGPECPAAPAGAIVIQFPFEELYSNRGAAAAVGSTVAADIAAGVYDIRLTSWDDHVEGDMVKPTQPNEIYHVEGFSNGTVVFESGQISDLPDDLNTLTEWVDQGVEVPALSAVRAVHSFPGLGNTANSIVPVCIVLVPRETTTTTVPEETTTTAPEETTTTVPEGTTTTEPEVSDTTVTTTPEEPEDTTTTTDPEVEAETTTTQPQETTTTAGPQVQAETTTTAGDTDETLPFTGVESDRLALMALLAVVAGGGLVWMTRRSSEMLGGDIGS